MAFVTSSWALHKSNKLKVKFESQHFKEKDDNAKSQPWYCDILFQFFKLLICTRLNLPDLNLTLFLLRFFLLLCSIFCILRPPTILILHKLYLTIYILLFLLFTRWYFLDYFMQDEHSFFLGINNAKYHDMLPLRSRKRSLVVFTSLVELLGQSNRGNRRYVKP